MGERQSVECGCGRTFTTTVRGRGTHCPQCGKRVYVRADGTVRPSGAVAPAGRASAAKRAKPSGAPMVVRQYVSLDEILADDAPKLDIEARSMWEMSQPEGEYPGLSVQDIADQYGVSASTVRKRIAAEQQRAAAEAAAQSGPVRPSSGNPRVRRGA